MGNQREEQLHANKGMSENLASSFAAHVKESEANFETIVEKLVQLNKWKEEFESSFQSHLNSKLKNAISKQNIDLLNEEQASLLEAKLKPFEERLADVEKAKNVANEDVLPEVEELKAKLKNLEGKNEELAKEMSNSFNDSIELLMNEMKKLMDNCKKLSDENEEIRAQLQKLPPSFKEQTDDKDLKEELNQLKESVKSIEERTNESSAGYQDMNLKLSVVNSKLAAVEKMMKQSDAEALEQLQADVDTLKAAKFSADKQQDAEDVLTELNDRVEAMENQIAESQTKPEMYNQLALRLDKLQLEANKKDEPGIEAMREDVQQVKEKQAGILGRMQETDTVLDEFADRLKALEEHMESLQKVHNGQVQSLQSELDGVKKDSMEESERVAELIEALKEDVNRLKESPNVVGVLATAKDEEPVVEKGRKMVSEDDKEPALEDVNANLNDIQVRVNELEERSKNNYEQAVKNMQAEIESLKQDIAFQDFVKNVDFNPQILALNTKINIMQEKLDNPKDKEELKKSIASLQDDIDWLRSAQSVKSKPLAGEGDYLLAEAAHSKANLPESTKAKKSPTTVEPGKKAGEETVAEYASQQKAPFEDSRQKEAAKVITESPKKEQEELKVSPKQKEEEKHPVEEEVYKETEKEKDNYKDESDGDKVNIANAIITDMEAFEPSNNVPIEDNKGVNIKSDSLFEHTSSAAIINPAETNKEVTNDFDIFDMQPAAGNFKEKDKNLVEDLGEALIADFEDSVDSELRPITNIAQDDFAASDEIVNPTEDKEGVHKGSEDEEIEENIVGQGLGEALIDDANNSKDSEAELTPEVDRQVDLPPMNSRSIDNPSLDSNERGEDSEKADPLENFADALLDDAVDASQRENSCSNDENAVFAQSMSDAQPEGGEFGDLLKHKPMTEVGDVDFLEQLPDAEDLESEGKVEEYSGVRGEGGSGEREEQAEAEELPESESR